MKIHILLATLLFAAPALVSAQNDAKDDPAGNLQKFQQFYRYLNGAYVDTVHNNELVESAIREVLLQLDPHSTYVSPEEMVEVKESFDGSFSGIGIEFNVLRDTIIVVNVISGGPAEQVGLLPNDRIVAVDGKSSVGVKQIDVPKLLRGPKGSRVETRIVRHGGGEPLDAPRGLAAVAVGEQPAAHGAQRLVHVHGGVKLAPLAGEFGADRPFRSVVEREGDDRRGGGCAALRAPLLFLWNLGFFPLGSFVLDSGF